MFYTFIILAIIITISIVYAVTHYVKDEAKLKKLDLIRQQERLETLREITTICKIIGNNEKQRKNSSRAIAELQATKRFVKEYY